MAQPYRVLIVDDHKHAREAMRYIVSKDTLFEVVGEGRSGADAVRLTEDWQPDLILMDINMKDMDGLAATKEIKDKYPYVKIVIVTVSDDALHLFDALKKGASGYLIKNLDTSSWLGYLRGIVLDDQPLSRDFAHLILKELTHQMNQSAAQASITAREKEILRWVATGSSNREIADRLFISEHTVKNHLKNILYKLKMDNRVQLARFAIENNISE
ncbi:response regulator [Cohnella soli]|uniref:Response regulator n=1 Tax=Cohnella soli TaxID=425005 RepID=A0ABW0HY04_9BACL